MPGSWLFQYSFRNGGSVASFCVTSYCSGVSFFRSSSSDGLAGAVIVPPLASFAAESGADCDWTQPASNRIRAKLCSFRGFNWGASWRWKTAWTALLFDAAGRQWLQERDPAHERREN